MTAKTKNRNKMIIIAIVCILLALIAMNIASASADKYSVETLEGKSITWSCYDPLDDYDFIITAQVVERDGKLVLEYIESETSIHTFVSDKIAEHGSKIGDDVKIYIKFH